MKHIYINNSAFTLIEIIVAMSIFGIIMVSVLSIFLFSSQMSTRVEMNRIMQENIKNITEDIAENMRKSSLADVIPDNSANSCNPDWPSFGVTGTKLCLASGIEYTIWYPSGDPVVWTKQNTLWECKDPNKPNCHIIKRDSPMEEYYPLSNSFSHFESLSFEITNQEIPKLYLHFTVRPSSNKWLANDIVENSLTHIQTTLSQRLITTQ